MKVKLTIVTYFALIISTTCYAQMNKDSLIQKAKTQLAPIIKNKGGDIATIDFSIYQTKVMAKGNDVMVYFNLPIKYLPCKTSYYANIVVELNSGTVHIQEVSNPKKSKRKPIFYTAPEQSKAVIGFVIEALNKNEPNSIDASLFTDEIIIADQEHFYRVIIQSPYYYSDYKIEKGTGEILDENHEVLEPDPDEELFVEIK